MSGVFTIMRAPGGDGAALGQPNDCVPDGYEAALFQGDRQVTEWVAGPPCRFGRIRPGPDRYKVRIADGRVYAGWLPVQPTGGNFTLDGPFRWGVEGERGPGHIVREQ